MKDHGYYMMPYYIILLAIVGFGASMLIAKKRFTILFILLLTQPILATVRILPARWLKEKKGVPPVLYNSESGKKIKGLIPSNKLTIVGPDISHCILFYFSNTKGFAFDSIDQLLSKETTNKTTIESYMNNGAEYLIFHQHNEDDIQQLKPYIDSVLFNQENILVAKLIRF